MSAVPPAAAPDSPRASESPPPAGILGDLELELLGLANALYNLGTTVINDSTKEKDKPGGGEKQVGPRVNDVVRSLAALEDMSRHADTMIPGEILTDIDNARNPMFFTRDIVENTAAENQFMNGKIAAIESYKALLDEALVQNFPELAPHLSKDTKPDQETSMLAEQDTPGTT